MNPNIRVCRWFSVAVDYDPELIAELKTLCPRGYDPETHYWWFPEHYYDDARRILAEHGITTDSQMERQRDKEWP